MLQPQHALPDIFIWMVSGGRRVAYHRLPARAVLYSMAEQETGQQCGATQTIFLRVSHVPSPPHLALAPASLCTASLLIHCVYFLHFVYTPRGFQVEKKTSTGPYRSCASLLNISNHLKYFVEFFLILMVWVWFGWSWYGSVD